MSLAGKVAIVTGASQGIGEGVAEAFIARDYSVLVTSRNMESAKRTDRILPVAVDIAEPGAAAHIVDQALSEFGRIDTLVNNVGMFLSKPFIEYSEDDLAQLLAVNLLSFYRMSQLCAAIMLQQGHGHIVSISTILVEQPMSAVPGVLPVMTKGGINAASRSMAIEYAGSGLRVNVVAPGVIKTPMNKPDHYDYLSTLHPMQRMGEIREIVDAVIYLENATFVTGEIINVDGGAHAGRW